MKIQNDQRVWLDKTQGLETFGAFEDQKFYSVQYAGEYNDLVRAEMARVERWQAWCKQAYMNARAGLDMPEPLFLLEDADVKAPQAAEAEEQQDA